MEVHPPFAINVLPFVIKTSGRRTGARAVRGALKAARPSAA
jgi:hypothetical protein